MRIKFQNLAAVFYLAVASCSEVDENMKMSRGFCKGKMTAEVKCQVDFRNTWTACNDPKVTSKKSAALCL